MYSIKKMANLANQILSTNKKGLYLEQKKIIKNIFNKYISDEKKYLIKIKIRLIVIDSFYGTNMNKRYFGIEDVAEAIKKLGNDNKINLKINEFIELIKLTNCNNNKIESNDIYKLFNEDYGIHKNLKNGGKATSLLSKYFYFLTEYKFPIFDSLIIKSYPKIIKYINKKADIKLKPLSKNDNIKKFYSKLAILNNETKIKNFDKLDNLLWLIGKINNGSFSLILSKNFYIKLIKKLKLKDYQKPTKNDRISRKKEDEINNKIKNRLMKCPEIIKESSSNKDFAKNLYNFIIFVKEINK